MEKRKKSWFDTFLEKHPYFPTGISCLALFITLLVSALNILKSLGYL